MSIAYLNGTFLPLTEAKISPLDRGFIFGDGVYEVIPVYAGRLFRLTEHLQRLDRSLASIQLANPLAQEQWQQALSQLVTENQGGDQSIYLQVTRGPAPRKHNFPPNPHPTVFMMSEPMVDPVPSEGAKAITLTDTRWSLCHIKSVSLLGSVLLREAAVQAGTTEAILLRNGYLTEGAASNVFVVHKKTVMTPPEGPFILTGITRDLIIETLQAAGHACQEVDISEQQLRNADEIWLTSSTREIVPIIALDDKIVGSGQPGPMWQIAWDLYQAYKQKLRQL